MEAGKGVWSKTLFFCAGRIKVWHEFKKAVVMSDVKKGRYVFNWSEKNRKWEVVIHTGV